MAYTIIATTLNLPYITPDPYKGALEFPLKEPLKSLDSNGLYGVADIKARALAHLQSLSRWFTLWEEDGPKV